MNQINPTKNTGAFFLSNTYPSLSKESNEILNQIKALNNTSFFHSNSNLMNKLKVIKSTELAQILELYFKEIIQDDKLQDPLQAIAQLAKVLSLEKIQAACHIDDAWKEAKSLFNEAQTYLDATKEKMSPKNYVRFSAILNGILTTIESIIMAFGISDFFQSADSNIQADFKSQKVMMLLHLFGMLTSLVLPALGAAVAGKIIGGVLFSVVALSIMWPWVKPKPSHLPANAENWTKEIQNGAYVPEGRKESLDEIANILRMNRHAMLLGPSRTGKSLTAKAFAQAIERGDYPEFKGFQVFRINMGDIVDQRPSFLGGGNNILNEIKTAMGRYNNKIILVFDEIHMACKDKATIADKLKTFLDKDGAFPHVIGITTKKEYKEYVEKNVAFSLRFDNVEIENTGPDETVSILGDTLLKEPSKPLIEGDVLTYIYQESLKKNNAAPQPLEAIKILERCINRTGRAQKSPKDVEITALSNSIKSLHFQLTASRSMGVDKSKRDKIALLKKKRKDLKEQRKADQNEIKKLFEAKVLLDKLTKEIYSSVIKVTGVGNKVLNSQNEKQLKQFLLMQEFLAGILKNYIKEKSATLGVKVIIDDKLVDEVVSAA